MNIGVTGATGFVGTAFCRLAAQKHSLIGFTRTPEGRAPANGLSEFRKFDPPRPIDASGLDAILHLAGESVFGFWTRKKKDRIRNSRVKGTRAVAAGAAASPKKPAVICASGVGYYGDSRSICNESAPPGNDFLAQTCIDWEGEANEASTAGCRVATARIGLVLGREGGALPIMLLPFRFFAGGTLGDVRRWVSPIHIIDLARLLLMLVESEDLRGPFNAVIPEPLSHGDFTHLLAKAVHRPAWLHTPAAILRLLGGEFANVILSSSRAVPERAMENGFEFHHPTAESAIEAALRI
jgi:uncharacterized protein (TIGR01777 family)